MLSFLRLPWKTPNDDTKEFFVEKQYKASSPRKPVAVFGYCYSGDAVIFEFGMQQALELLRVLMAATPFVSKDGRIEEQEMFLF